MKGYSKSETGKSIVHVNPGRRSLSTLIIFQCVRNVTEHEPDSGRGTGEISKTRAALKDNAGDS